MTESRRCVESSITVVSGLAAEPCSEETDAGDVIETAGGSSKTETEEAEGLIVIQQADGFFRNPVTARVLDPVTAEIRVLAATYTDVKKIRVAQSGNRLKNMEAVSRKGSMALEATIEDLGKVEIFLARKLERLLRQHILWLGFLSELPGVTGASMARILGYIGDPWRYPGQRCTEGHYFRPIYPVGSPCPAKIREGRGEQAELKDCLGFMLDPRPHSGVRSLWHDFGLHPGARKSKGTKADFNPEIKGWILGPQGLADQMVRQGGKAADKNGRLRDPRGMRKYLDIRDETKKRLAEGRGVLIEERVESESSSDEGLRPFQIDAIARKVTVKALLGDLLIEWKRRMPLTVDVPVSEASRGEPSVA